MYYVHYYSGKMSWSLLAALRNLMTNKAQVHVLINVTVLKSLLGLSREVAAN